MLSSSKGTIRDVQQMKKFPRKGSHGSGKQDGRKPRFSRELLLLYEDDAVVAVNKPAGLAAVPVKGADTPSALALLTAELNSKRQRAFVVHRIDRFTSGILFLQKLSPTGMPSYGSFLAILR